MLLHLRLLRNGMPGRKLQEIIAISVSHVDTLSDGIDVLAQFFIVVTAVWIIMLEFLDDRG